MRRWVNIISIILYFEGCGANSKISRKGKKIKKSKISQAMQVRLSSGDYKGGWCHIACGRNHSHRDKFYHWFKRQSFKTSWSTAPPCSLSEPPQPLSAQVKGFPLICHPAVCLEQHVKLGTLSARGMRHVSMDIKKNNNRPKLLRKQRCIK